PTCDLAPPGRTPTQTGHGAQRPQSPGAAGLAHAQCRRRRVWARRRTRPQCATGPASRRRPHHRLTAKGWAAAPLRAALHPSRPGRRGQTGHRPDTLFRGPPREPAPGADTPQAASPGRTPLRPPRLLRRGGPVPVPVGPRGGQVVVVPFLGARRCGPGIRTDLGEPPASARHRAPASPGLGGLWTASPGAPPSLLAASVSLSRVRQPEPFQKHPKPVCFRYMLEAQGARKRPLDATVIPTTEGSRKQLPSTSD
ncbi:hypothetical protein H1C71_039749, partial [Ictidomys tridecemlineatus]